MHENKDGIEKKGQKLLIRVTIHYVTQGVEVGYEPCL